MTRKERWIGLIDRNLDYLFCNQRPEGSIGEDRSRGTVQMAHAAAWAFLAPKSKYFRKQEAAERAQRAMDFLARNVDGSLFNIPNATFSSTPEASLNA